MRPVDVVEVGDRIRFGGGVHVLAGLDGPRCRLVAEEGARVQVLLLTQVLGAQDFAVLDPRRPRRSRVPVHGPLDELEPAVREKALAWERHILEVETGHIGPHRDWPSRPRYDPAVYGLAEREATKAAELTAAGEQVSMATVRRMRARYREQGVWGLVDGRLTRERSAFGRADPRVVAAIKRALEEQQGRSTGTLTRLRRQVGWLLKDAHGPGAVAVPPVATFNRLVRSVAEQEQLALTAADHQRRASRPAPVFTPTVATLPGELVMMDSTLLDVMVVCEDGRARPRGSCARRSGRSGSPTPTGGLPLSWTHVNPYGRFELGMNSPLALAAAASMVPGPHTAPDTRTGEPAAEGAAGSAS
ncbi:hypothetical protein ACIGBH_40515 [Streptomyces sp. NPDC085929]|uniref:hypothetical protein n=1 Tax=Streptomyces sp. NPDC085929 TaxID=3365739 RepID=UPI0037D89838